MCGDWTVHTFCVLSLWITVSRNRSALSCTSSVKYVQLARHDGAGRREGVTASMGLRAAEGCRGYENHQITGASSESKQHLHSLLKLKRGYPIFLQLTLIGN